MIIPGYFNTTLSPIGHAHKKTKQKPKSDIKLNGIVHQMDLTEIYRTFHSNATEYAFFPVAHGASTYIWHKANLNKRKEN